MRIQIRRAYDRPRRSDGYRVLVDRVWPEVRDLVKRARQGRVTLGYGARDPAHNQAVALRAYLRARAARRQPRAR